MTTPGGSPGGAAARCAVCEAEAAPEASYCIACGQPLATPLNQSLDASLATQRALRGLAPMRAPMRVVEANASAPALPLALDERRGGAMGSTGLAALPRLAALAWRQPAVRSVVTTGASAVALSLVWRVAGAALRGGQARRALFRDLRDFAPDTPLDPLVEELLRDATPSKRLSKRSGRRAGRRGRRGEVIEELVYVRRIFRR